MTAPFKNCEFEICDLKGQCLGEGKCHHPKKVTVEMLDEIQALRQQVAELEAKLIKQIEYSTMCNQEAVNMEHWYITMLDRNEELQAKLAIATVALVFYSDCKHFNNRSDGKEEIVDFGEVADEALIKIKGE